MDVSESVLKFTVLWRGKKFIVKMNSGASLKEFGYELQKLTDIKSDTMRLIVPEFSSKSSKLLYPFSDEHSSLNVLEISMDEGKAIRLMGVPEAEVEKILENEKVDSRILGFDEEEKRIRRRMLGMPTGFLKLPQGTYVFADFRTLELPGVQLNPPASEALKRMHMLAADPGIVAIMNKHRWRVGIMTEMAPVGYVGVSPKCLLGFNKNRGEEISLRLRTDDLKGFRKYESIKKTLLHELAHMVYSEHDANFYSLDKQLNQEAATLDWTRAQSRTLSGSRPSNHHEGDYFDSGITNQPLKVGGSIYDRSANARESSVAAAYSRIEHASIMSEVDAEPDPDDSGYDLPTKVRRGMKDLHEQNKLEHGPKPDDLDAQIDIEADPNESHGITQDQIKWEPDTDEHADMRTEVEPTPDDLQGINVESAFVVSDNRITNSVDSLRIDEKSMLREPDPDASSMTKNGFQSEETMREPDSDEENDLGHGSDTKTVTMHAEPDPDNSSSDLLRASQMQIAEPDPDDKEMLSRIQDPVSILSSRIQKAIDSLRNEVDPIEASTILGTLVTIIRNVMEHPNEMKYKKLRKSNPVIQSKVAKYRAAMEILSLIGFGEDSIVDDTGKPEPYLVLKRNDPGLLWLAKSFIETFMTC